MDMQEYGRGCSLYMFPLIDVRGQIIKVVPSVQMQQNNCPHYTLSREQLHVYFKADEPFYFQIAYQYHEYDWNATY